MNEKQEKTETNNWQLKTIALPKSLIRDSIAEAERRNYGKGIQALQYLIYEKLLPFSQESIEKRKELL
jgi:hypothetical protein